MIAVRPLELLCTVCYAGGCVSPPVGVERVREILSCTKNDGWLDIRMEADKDIICAHYRDVYGGGTTEDLPRDFKKRSDDFVGRLKDWSILQKLGLQPGDIRPAYELLRLLFWNIETLDGICCHNSEAEGGWEDCPYAQKRYYEKARGKDPLIAQGLTIGGAHNNPVYIFLTPRSEEEMAKAKRESVEKIQKVDRFFIRPSHLLCLACLYGSGNNAPLEGDNLYELRVRMEERPDIPITLTEGCGMTCDPCPAYDVPRNICYHAHPRNHLFDLMTFRKLGLRPGATLPARQMYQRLFNRIRTAKEICGWGNMKNVTAEWKYCDDVASGHYENAIAQGFLGTSAQENPPSQRDSLA